MINLAGHTSPIQAMKVVGNSLISVERNGQVIFWDLATGQQASARSAYECAQVVSGRAAHHARCGRSRLESQR